VPANPFPASHLKSDGYFKSWVKKKEAGVWHRDAAGPAAGLVGVLFRGAGDDGWKNFFFLNFVFGRIWKMLTFFPLNLCPSTRFWRYFWNRTTRKPILRKKKFSPYEMPGKGKTANSHFSRPAIEPTGCFATTFCPKKTFWKNFVSGRMWKMSTFFPFNPCLPTRFWRYFWNRTIISKVRQKNPLFFWRKISTPTASTLTSHLGPKKKFQNIFFGRIWKMLTFFPFNLCPSTRFWRHFWNRTIISKVRPQIWPKQLFSKNFVFGRIWKMLTFFPSNPCLPTRFWRYFWNRTTRKSILTKKKPTPICGHTRCQVREKRPILTCVGPKNR